MSVKLLALDIDGTLLNSQMKVTERTKVVLQRAVAAGVKVVLVTGRRFHAARPIAQQLDLALPLITHNGVLVKDTTTLEVIDFQPLEANLAKELVHLGRQYYADTLCCDDPHGEGRIVFENISPANQRLWTYVNTFSQYAQKVSDLQEYIDSALIQVFYCGPCNLMDEMAAHLTTYFAGKVKVVMTAYRRHDMTILDAININCSKGHALSRLAASLGITAAEVMAVGDNQNDLEMLQYAGLPVMMANADVSLQQQGFATTLSNDEDGVAVAVERYILATL
jgi:Cof subfamily protein (haloacid dehalogenase superfamily)